VTGHDSRAVCVREPPARAERAVSEGSGARGGGLREMAGFKWRRANHDDPDSGRLEEHPLSNTDVLIWWGPRAARAGRRETRSRTGSTKAGAAGGNGLRLPPLAATTPSIPSGPWATGHLKVAGASRTTRRRITVCAPRPRSRKRRGLYDRGEEMYGCSLRRGERRPWCSNPTSPSRLASTLRICWTVGDAIVPLFTSGPAGAGSGAGRGTRLSYCRPGPRDVPGQLRHV
jgi:hypothetical protein